MDKKLFLVLVVLFIWFLTSNYSSFTETSTDLDLTFNFDPTFLPTGAIRSPQDGNLRFLVVTDSTDCSSVYNSQDKIVPLNEATSIPLKIPQSGGVFILTPFSATPQLKMSIYYYNYRTLNDIIKLEKTNTIKINSIYCTSTYPTNSNCERYIKSVQNPDSNGIGQLSDQYWNTNTLYGINSILNKWYYNSFNPVTVLNASNHELTITPFIGINPYIKVIGNIINQMNGYINLNYLPNGSPIEYQMYHVNPNQIANLSIPKQGGILVYWGVDDITKVVNVAYFPINNYNVPKLILSNTSTKINLNS